MEFTLLGAAFVAVIALYAILYWEARRGNAADCTRNLWEIAISAGVFGLLVGRLAAMIGDGVNPITNPADIIVVRGGVATGPAAAAALLTAAWLGRRELWPVLDGLAAAALAGLGGWHLGCVVRDTCLGTPSDLPWAMSQPGSTIGRHPVELYAAIALLSGALVLVWVRSRSNLRPAVAAGAALAWAGAVRLATEPLRPALSTGPILWYWGAIALGLLVLATHQRAAATVADQSTD
jgi:prolipoprotein diacylglyceryltransferase